jgi:hypothetical protein
MATEGSDEVTSTKEELPPEQTKKSASKLSRLGSSFRIGLEDDGKLFRFVKETKEQEDKPAGELRNLASLESGLGVGAEGSIRSRAGSECSRASVQSKVRRLTLQAERVESLERVAMDATRASIESARSARSGRSESMTSTLGEESTVLEAASGVDGEPKIHTKEDLKRWTKWAKEEATLSLNFVHPRLQRYEGAPSAGRAAKTKRRFSAMLKGKGKPYGADTGDVEVKIEAPAPAARDASSSMEGLQLKTTPVPMCATDTDLGSVMGVGIRLYFDLIKLFVGFGILGMVFSIPSYIASLAHLHRSVYSGANGESATDLAFPQSTAVVSLGARASELDAAFGEWVGCTEESCNALNNLTALLEVVYCLLFLLTVHAFRKYCKAMQLIDSEENVRIED